MKAQLNLILALLLICSGAALAETPDGQTPALESVCDLEQGAAYGLCNAYCEAMDCESVNPSASEAACTKVRDKFQNITGRNVPCENPCPCANIPQFNAVLEEVNYCIENDSAVTVSPVPIDLVSPTAFTHKTLGGFCQYAGPDAFVEIRISPEQTDACTQLLLDAAASRGVTCEPF